MAAVNFIAIPCEPHTAHKVQGKPYFCNICLCANDIVHLGLKMLELFCRFFVTVVEVFIRLDLKINAPVAFFLFLTEDRIPLFYK